MLSKCSHDFHYCIHRVFIMNILIIYDCPFFVRIDVYSLFSTIIAAYCQETTQGKKNKSNRSQSKEAKKSKRQKSKRPRLPYFLPSCFLPSCLSGCLPSFLFFPYFFFDPEYFFLIRNMFLIQNNCFLTPILMLKAF